MNNGGNKSEVGKKDVRDRKISHCDVKIMTASEDITIMNALCSMCDKSKHRFVQTRNLANLLGRSALDMNVRMNLILEP